jgi:ABC-type amino acid transport substrate-binding protein
MDDMLRQRRFWIIIVLGLLLGPLVAWLTAPGRSPLGFLAGQDQTWRTVESRGVWRVGMDPSFPPFQSLNEEGVPVGFDVDLARAMAETWGVEAEIVAIGFDSLLDALQTGKIDSVVSALPYDPRETKDFRFSEPYFEAGVRLAIPMGSSIAGPDDLADRTLAVEWGSSGDMLGRQLQREGISLTLAPYPAPDEVISALVAGADGVEAALVDNITLREAQGQGAHVTAVGPPLEGSPYVIASPYRAHEMAAQINAALAVLDENGRLNELEARWFGPRPTASAEDSSTETPPSSD